jgi:hypothetical protein
MVQCLLQPQKLLIEFINIKEEKKMTQQVYQLRFNTNNDNITSDELISPAGQMFQHIHQLSIESHPGFQCLINNIPIVIGVTGIYEVYLEETDLTLRFNPASVQNLVQSGYPLIVSIVYDKEETESE